MTQKMLLLKAVSYRDSAGEDILTDIDMAFKAGVVYFIVCQDALGEKTLVQLMAGLKRASRGDIELNGDLLSEMKLGDFRKNRLSLISDQNGLIADYTVRENLEMPMEISGTKVNKIANIKSSLEKIGVQDHVLSLKVRDLDKTLKDKLTIAKGLVKDSELIIVDRFLDGIDNPEEMLDLLESVAKEKEIVLIIFTNSSRVLDLAQNVSAIKNKRFLTVKE